MRKFRAFALVLSLCLLVSLLPGGVLASDDAVHISTPSRLRELSDKCRLDSWSVGKSFVLDCDIDMGGIEFEPIPSFGGSFDGGGHTISGLYVKGGGSAVGGLFRYVQSGARVENLNVEGVIAPELNAESFGGIAGENSGTISQCTFSGTVSGSVETGGIVGVNGSDGIITDCRSLAAVSGEHYTGGIAGRNLGSIIRCSNLGPVNTTNPEMEGESLDIDWEHLNSMENVSAHTDTGGITGFSQGTLEQCVNRGNVGYPHVGYNVGGVAGRQSGFVDSCRNFGLVNGRKDVGGVVGQMVPDIRLQFSGTAMSQLSAEMDTLQTLLDELISDVQGSSNEISGILSDAGAYLSSAGQSAGRIVDSITGFVDGNLDSVNDFVSRVQSYVARLADIAADIESCFDCLSEAVMGLDAFLDEPANKDIYPQIYDELSGSAESVELAMAQLTVAMDKLDKAADTLSGTLESFGSSSPGGDELRYAFESFLTAAGEAADQAGDAMKLFDDAVEKLGNAGEKMEQLELSGSLPAALSHSLSKFREAVGHLESAISGLESLIYDLGREDSNAFEGLGEDFMEETDRMEAALAGLSGQMEKLNTAVNGSVNVMSSDLRLVNDQFFKVMDCFVDMLESSTDASEIYEDMSEEEIFSATGGKVQKSENRGDVAGDVNTGGIVGSMGIEYDLDPEEDISVSGTAEGSFRYFTKAILLESVNFGTVSGKKDCVGGAVGYMDLGVVYGCENYGSASSASGDYVGGIVGQSAAAVRSCWNLCSVSGRDYIGGIAGTVYDVSFCRSLADISATGGWKGAIAGEVTGGAEANYFVGEGLGGIDDVSYAGKAEPQRYSEFILAEGLPGEFKDFKLTFATDSVLVKSIPFTYGKSIDLTEIPPVPERVGYVGSWESYDYTNLSFSDTIHAVYTPYETVVAAENRVGKRSVLLLQGSFLPGTVPVLENCADAPAGSLEAWTVSCSGLVERGYLLRYLAPGEPEETDIYVLRDGSWQKTEITSEGSYLLFEGGGESMSFAALERERSIPAWPFVLTAAAGAALAAFVLVIRARTGKKKGNKKEVNN